MKKIFILGLLITSVSFLTGCNLNSTAVTPETEQDRFISASTETTCYFFDQKSFNLSDNSDLSEIVSKYGFETYETFQLLASQYANDEDIKQKIMEGMEKKCPKIMEKMMKLGQ